MNNKFIDQLSQKLYNDQDNIILQEQIGDVDKLSTSERRKLVEETRKELGVIETKLVMGKTDYTKQIYLNKLIEKYDL